MKITVLAPYSRPHEKDDVEGSGMNQYIRESALALAKLGHIVTILVRKSRKIDQDCELAAGVRIQFVDAGSASRLSRHEVYSALQEHIDSFNIAPDTDLCIAHYWISTAWIEKIQKQYFGAIVYCSHSFTFNNRRTVTDYKALVAESKLLKRVVWCTNTIKEFEVMKTVLPKDRVFMTYPGVDLPVITTSCASSESGAKTRVLFLGRNNRAKGFDLLRSAIQNIADTTFLAVGRMEMETEKMDNLTIQNHVPINEAYQLISDSDVIVCPSRYEHFGFVPLIAALLGKKIVATNEGVVFDLQNFGYKNLFISQPESDDLQSTIVKALNTKSVDTVTDFLAEKFSWEKWSHSVIKTAVSSTTVYCGKFAKVEISPKEVEGGLVWYESVTMPGSVHVIPVNKNGEFGFIKEIRFQHNQPVERILSGSIDTDEAPKEAARRELEEEIGLKTDNLELFYTNESSGTIRDKKYYYLAHDCTADGNIMHEKGEQIIETNYYSKAEIQTRILKNPCSAASTLALLSLCGIFPTE